MPYGLRMFLFIFSAEVANLIYIFIIIIFRSSSIVGTIGPFSTEAYPVDVGKFKLVEVSVHYLRIGFTY